MIRNKTGKVNRKLMVKGPACQPREFSFHAKCGRWEIDLLRLHFRKTTVSAIEHEQETVRLRR